jgi:hypothetical protein
MLSRGFEFNAPLPAKIKVCLTIIYPERIQFIKLITFVWV